MKTILYVEDDLKLRDALFNELNKEYNVLLARSKEDAVRCLESKSIDIYLLDVNLPDGNGYDLCELIRKKCKKPIIFLTVCDDEDSVVNGLECGADDYVTKPFSLKILKSRIMSNLRRYEMQENQVKTMDGMIQVNSGDYNLLKDGTILYCDQKIMLTATESSLVGKLMVNKGCIVKKSALFDCVESENGNFIDENTIRVYISRIRRKLRSKKGECPIETINKIGYRWKI